MRKEVEPFFGYSVYPDCEFAVQYVPIMKNCLCSALQGHEGCAENGNYWCGAATDDGKCPKGLK